MNTMKLEIITPMGKIFDNQVKYASIPGSEGEFGVLPGHSKMVTMLAPGVIEIEELDSVTEAVAITWGYAEVSEDGVTILADGAVMVSSRDKSELKSSLDEAHSLLKDASDSSTAIAAAMSKIDRIVA